MKYAFSVIPLCFLCIGACAPKEAPVAVNAIEAAKASPSPEPKKEEKKPAKKK